MGVKQSKNEGCYLPETPVIKKISKNQGRLPQKLEEKNYPTQQIIQNSKDPRSPNICRTPIYLQYTKKNSPMAEQILEVSNDNPLNVMRKRLLKTFTYNARDPRSPKLNRTPLLLDEQTDRTLNLDDTFADLFVETNAATASCQNDNTKGEAAATVETLPIDDAIYVETHDAEHHITKENCETVSLTEFIIEESSSATLNIMLDDAMQLEPGAAMKFLTTEREERYSVTEYINTTGKCITEFIQKRTAREQIPVADEAGATVKSVLNDNADNTEQQITTENDETVAGGMFVSELTQATANEQTPVALQQHIDPRSPTLGLERTPIIFTDDDEATEDAMLEDILGTLSLNLSSNSSLALFGTPTGNISSPSAETKINTSITPAKPSNKHLDRVRVGKKRSYIPQRRTLPAQRPRIYEDAENLNSAQKIATQTPPFKNKSPKYVGSSTAGSDAKRTPLSCVRNRSHIRSYSVGTSAKSLKTNLPLTGFDDNLDAEENVKLASLRIMRCGSEDSQEL